jgi:uncharacterized membrane protein YdfJ with MMPL/SSD domain
MTLSGLSTESLARSSATHPWRTVLIWTAALVLGFVLISLLLESATTVEGNFTNSPDSKVAQDLVEERIRPTRAQETAVITSSTLTVDDPAFKNAVVAFTDGLINLGPEIIHEGDNGLEVHNFYDTGIEAFVSEDRSTTLVPFTMDGDLTDATLNIKDVIDIGDEITASTEVEVLITGPAAIGSDFEELAINDLLTGEMIGGGIALLILLMVFRAGGAAWIPVVTALIAILLAVAVVSVAGQISKVSFFITNIITMIGLAVGIDYSLFILARFREERARGLEKLDAIAKAGSTATRAVVFSGITVVFALLGMVIVPTSVFFSVGFGAVVVTIIAVLAAVTLLPAILSFVDGAVNKLTPRRIVGWLLWALPRLLLIASLLQAADENDETAAVFAVIAAALFVVLPRITSALISSAPLVRVSTPGAPQWSIYAAAAISIAGGLVALGSADIGIPILVLALLAGTVAPNIQTVPDRWTATRNKINNFLPGIPGPGILVQGWRLLMVLVAANLAVVYSTVLRSFLAPPSLPEIGYAGWPDIHEDSSGGFWNNITNIVMRRPWPALILIGGLLILATIPYFNIRTGAAGIDTLPDNFRSLQAFNVLRAEFPTQVGGVSAADIVIDGDLDDPEIQAGIDRLKASLVGHPVFGDPNPFIETQQDGEFGSIDEVIHLRIAMPVDSATRMATNAVKELRESYIPNAQIPADVFVGGQAAINEDFFTLSDKWTPIVITFVLALSFVFLTVVFRSLIVPIKAIILNLLSVGAAYGMLVLVLQEGVGNEIFGFTQADTIEAWLPVFLFSILFGLSMDYEVFLLSRIRERYDQTGLNAESVAFGLRSTAGIITGAALIMVAVFGGFAVGDLVIFQQMGFGLGAAILVDATLIRAVLVPASMKLLGDNNWYFPSFLEWLPDLRVEGDEAPVLSPSGAEDIGAGK